MERKHLGILCCLFLSLGLVTSIGIVMFIDDDFVFEGFNWPNWPNWSDWIPWGDDDTTTTTTVPTDSTTTTTTTTTTVPVEDNIYRIKFSFLWGDNIPEEDKCWMEFAVHNYQDTSSAGKRDQVTLAAGHGDTGDWFYGSWGEEFADGEALTVTMESHGDWYDLLVWPDVSVGPWSHSFTFYSYKYGFDDTLTGTLMITWELV